MLKDLPLKSTTFKRLALSAVVMSTLYIAPSLHHELGQLRAETSDAETQKKSVKVPAMRNRVYAQLARAQKLSDEDKKVEGYEVLNDVEDQLSNLNSYERAMLWNFYGFMHYGDDDIEKAASYFTKVVQEEAIPHSLRLSTLYSLAQLSMQVQDYQGALDNLKAWEKINAKPLSANQNILYAQIYYQLKDFTSSINYTKQTIETTISANKVPKENWLILQRASYYELKQPVLVTRTMELLVRYYDKPDYWIQLAGMYGEIQEEEKQLAVMESAYQAGYVVKSGDIITLVQLYRYHGAPIKAANLLYGAIEKGDVVANERHLEMLAQSYIAAKDDEKSIPVLMQAAKIAETGKYDAQLAQSYLNLEKWALAITSSQKALERGLESHQGNMHLVQGMAYFNLQQFERSLEAFEEATYFDDALKIAKQWSHYVVKEQDHQSRLAMLNKVQ